MNCEELRVFVNTYVDKEFSERELVECEVHFSQCPNCRNDARFYLLYRQMMRERFPRAITPLRVNTSLRKRLHDVERSEHRYHGFSFSFATFLSIFFVGVAFFPSLLSEHFIRKSYHNPSKAKSTVAVRKRAVRARPAVKRVILPALPRTYPRFRAVPDFGAKFIWKKREIFVVDEVRDTRGLRRLTKGTLHPTQIRGQSKKLMIIRSRNSSLRNTYPNSTKHNKLPMKKNTQSKVCIDKKK